MFSFHQILATRPDPLDVLKTTAPVVQHARHVRIDYARTERAANQLASTRVEPPAWNYEYHFFDGTPRTGNYLFLLDALNFCFWGAPRWQVEHKGKLLNGYWALAASLKRAAEENPRVLDAEFLAHISPAELAHILRGKGEIPLFAERWRNARELGAVLRDRWNGDAARLVESANSDAARLARLIAESFASFNDVAVYDTSEGERGGQGERERGRFSRAPALPRSHSRTASKHAVHFYKRAQILVTDLWGAFGGKAWGAFSNINELTAFADYKLPQILRAWGVLKYAPRLARAVDAQKEIAAGSAEEVEIRAATLWAVEFLREALAARGRKMMSVEVDWILWEASQSKFEGLVLSGVEGMKPYHRVRTIYY